MSDFNEALVEGRISDIKVNSLLNVLFADFRVNVHSRNGFSSSDRKGFVPVRVIGQGAVSYRKEPLEVCS